MSWYHIILMNWTLRVVLSDHGNLSLLFEQVLNFCLWNRLVEGCVNILLIEPFILYEIFFLGIVLIFIRLVRAVGAQEIECILEIIDVFLLNLVIIPQEVEAPDRLVSVKVFRGLLVVDFAHVKVVEVERGHLILFL